MLWSPTITCANKGMENPAFPMLPRPQEPLDWTYSMRRDMQEIIPGLFLGPYSSAMRSKCEQLSKAGITHIVCIRQDVEANFIRPNFPDKFLYLVLDIADSQTSNIIQYIPQVKRFVDSCLLNGGRVLIHGNGGISRSAALAIGYIMETYGLPYNQVFTFVQQKRFCISPNEGFVSQLREYEPIYRAKLTLERGETSHGAGKLKRRIEEVEDMDSWEAMS
ncbi:serine/threonine/tyrosine-interacting protein A-like isoform X2 [Ornithodoros turicata]|uniref:serine/threonine/tyrosine-interacting protein A-like isoform X2 n=1 Tax=Ornithodoros turicata TaxID=34597 RepID=UPI003138F5AC